MKLTAQSSIFTAVLLVQLTTHAASETTTAPEMQCAPTGTAIAFPISDTFYASERMSWARITRQRYLEGNGACPDFAVSGYEGFPTKRCSYANADAGKKHFAPLAAEVVLLDPSAQQLASWSVLGCRAAGAADNHMRKCLDKLRQYIAISNNAQFPVVGSVVESKCNSSAKLYPKGCTALPEEDAGRQPRNTWFRDGVAVDYKPSIGIFWDETAYPTNRYDELFDVTRSDSSLSTAYALARVAGAVRADWTDWRQHAGRQVGTDAIDGGGLAGKAWLTVSREVHKAACKSDRNALFSAVAYRFRQSWQ